MTDKQAFDPSAMIAATREAFAPVLKAQQESFKTFERLARLQYAVAGDVLESNLARVSATFVATSPSDLLSKQSELSTQLAEKLRDRAEEFATVTSEIQAKFGQLGNEFAAKTMRARKAA
jgi:phasin family protein